MTLPVIEPQAGGFTQAPSINPALAAQWLEAFLKDELVDGRGVERAVIGLSGGVDSAVTAFLCARALGPKNVFGVRMPYKHSSPASLTDARLVTEALGINESTVEITAAADGYLQL